MRYGPTTALIVVDVQNDFADPDGSLSVPGAAAVIVSVNREVAEAARGGATIIATQDWHPDVTPHFAKDGGPWPVHCVGGTWGAELDPRLELPDAAPRVRKGANGEDGYSGFTMRDPTTGATSPTELDGLLRAANVESVVVVGLATDYCVKATALDAVGLGYKAAVVTEAVAAVDVQSGDGRGALDELAAAGVELLGSAPAP
jgi:nicotinamidase/pyrazinamidase